jgi:hypothetical protein
MGECRFQNCVLAPDPAIAGQTEHRIAAFRAEVADVARTRVPVIVREQLRSLADAVGKVAFTGLVENQA